MLSEQSSSTIELLKWIAIISMMIDHISLILLEDNEVLHFIGRIAFPIFAYILIHNYIYYTSNKKYYIFRLLIFSLISQPIYCFAINGSLNIFILLSLALLTIYTMEKIHQSYAYNKPIEIILHFYTFLFGSSIALFASYSLEGYFFLLLLYLGFRERKYTFLILLSMGILNINNIFYVLGTYVSISVFYFSQKSTIHIRRLSKWLFYAFYPIHILILHFIHLL